MYVLDLPKSADGKRRQQKRRGYRTRKAAEEALQKALQLISTGGWVEPSRLTLRDYLVDTWLPFTMDRVRPSTFASYQGNIERHVLPHLGHVPIQSLTPPMLSTLYRSLQTDTGLSAKTVRHVHTTLKKSFTDAGRWNILELNPADAADPPIVRRSAMTTWTPQEVREFLVFLRGDHLETYFTLLATTGMRRGEALGVSWAHLDLETGRLSVQQQLTSVKYKLVFDEPKTDRGRRSIPLDRTTVSMLRRHRAQQAQWRLAMGSDWANDRDLVFTKPDGSPIHPDTVSDTFDRRVKSSGLRRIRLHDLRHTWATLALEAGVPIKVVSEVLGHASPAFTMDVYAHVTPVMMEDLARIVGDTIFGPQPTPLPE
jgi:integrase